MFESLEAGFVLMVRSFNDLETGWGTQALNTVVYLEAVSTHYILMIQRKSITVSSVQ